MTSWRTYADPPQADPALARSQRRAQARAMRDTVDFDEALRSGSTGFVVWMCADALDAVSGPSGVVLDAAHVDDALPGPWERDLMDLARLRAPTGRAAEALAEGYQQGVAWVAEKPLHEARGEAVRRAGRLAEKVPASAAQAADTAVRRLVARDARVRLDRAAARWGCKVDHLADLSAEVAQYRESLPEPVHRMLAQYRVADAVGGAEGQALLVLSRGLDADDVILLEAMSARPSSREAAMGAWRGGSDVHRVLLAREMVSLVPAEFAGWSTSADGAVGRVWSRVRAAARDVDLGGSRDSARRWGAVLGLLHAAGSDAASLAGYVGRSRRFPAAVRQVLREERDLRD
jgi:hypothetical protein